MATIKAYTNIEQSRKLAKILSIESADMIYIMYHNGEKPQNGDANLSTVYESNEHKWYWIDIIDESFDIRNGVDIPCWSLAALLNGLPEIQGGKPIIALDDNYITYPHMSDLHIKADSLVDACVAMIEKLNELKML